MSLSMCLSFPISGNSFFFSIMPYSEILVLIMENQLNTAGRIQKVIQTFFGMKSFLAPTVVQNGTTDDNSRSY